MVCFTVAAQLRCAVIGQHSNDQRTFIGYVLSNYETDLKTLRIKIEELLREPSQVTNHKLSLGFHFIHSFHYSIHRHNESNILLVDIMQKKCVFIRFDHLVDMFNTDSRMAIQDKYLNNDDDLTTGGHVGDDQIDFSNKMKPIKKPSM